MEVRNVEAIPLQYEFDDDALMTGRGDPITSRPMTLVRVETADGLVGWGEAFGPPRTNAAILDEVVADIVTGMDPFEAETLCDPTYAGLYHFARRGPIQCVLSAVDIACWDLLGKALDRPVHALLGGPTRTEVTPYASTMMHFDGGADGLETDSAEQLRTALEEGFRAAKIKVGRGIEDDVRRVEVAREIMGDDAHVMVDMNGNYRTDQAVRAVRALEPYELTWIEEPILPHTVSGYAEISSHTATPLAAGEAVYSRFGFEELLDVGGVDVIQPDMSKVGGLSEARFVAKLATTENVSVSPHCWNGPVSLAAALQFAAAVPRYPHTTHSPEPFFVEVDRSENPMRDALMDDQLDVTGETIRIPDTPGLGISPNEDAIERYRA